MKNEKATPEITAFASAVLAMLHKAKPKKFGHIDYLPDEATDEALRTLAVATGFSKPAPESGRYGLQVEYNQQAIIFHLAASDPDPVIEARKIVGSGHYATQSIRRAALIMLDRLPQVRRTQLTDEERDHVAGKINAGASFAFVDQMLVAVLRATPKQAGKLVRAFPRTFHKLLKDFSAE